MSDKLEIKMFGTPSVFLNDIPLTLPYRQAEALLYYLLLNKKVSKYTLADIIWGDKCSEEKINSNLRNAFYILRKHIGKNFIEKNANDQISIGGDFCITTDVEQFLAASGSPELYTGDFLEGFFLKNNTLYNDWVSNTRQLLKNSYMKNLHTAIIQEFDSGNYDTCEALCHKQIQINEFDETAYKHLMQIYQRKGNYTLALKIYNQLEELLEQELFERPQADTQALGAAIEEALNTEISQLLEARKELKSLNPSSSFLYGREQELKSLENILNSFQQELPHKNILISGEAGIGKTTLAEHLLPQGDTSDTLYLKARCYYAEEKYILKSWQNIAHQLIHHLEEQNLTQKYSFLIQSIWALFPFFKKDCSTTMDADDISTLDYKSIQSAFVNALLQFSYHQKLVIYIDDVQWADEISLSLIRDLITSTRSYDTRHILFLMTSRSHPDTTIRHLFDNMYALGQLEIISLSRFGFSDTIDMAARLLPDYDFTPDIQKKLFHETEGNALFITEAVNHLRYNGSPDDITPNMRNIIEQRIAPVPREYLQILNLVSIFFDGISFECLSALSHKEDYELVEILEYLLLHNLLKEDFDQDNTFFSFTHQKLSEFVYEEMSWTKKRILHNKAGLYYEQKLNGNIYDMSLYPKLIYHFDKGANQQKYLKYVVKYLYNYLNVTHEFFPVIENNLTLFTLDMRKETPDSLTADLGSIEKLLHSIEDRVNSNIHDFLTDVSDRDEDLEILSDYLHMIGRHYIRTCNYEQGLRYILQLKKINETNDSPIRLTRLLQANRQLICVYINRYEPAEMEKILVDSLELLKEAALPEEMAVWQRLYGLCCIMQGKLSDGIEHLETAISLFTKSAEKEKHLYNLAAAYSWIGETHRHSMDYEKALEYYNTAIHICSRNFLVSGVSIFYAYAGMAAYDSRRLPEAERYLTDAIQHYETGNLMWGRSLPYAYYGLLLLEKGECESAFKHLESAYFYASKLESPYEQGIIFRIYAQIKSGIYDRASNKKARTYLKEDWNVYYIKATDLLKQVYSPIDMYYLKELH